MGSPTPTAGYYYYASHKINGSRLRDWLRSPLLSAHLSRGELLSLYPSGFVPFATANVSKVAIPTQGEKGGGPPHEVRREVALP
jgi:hypothetical protein